ncbi:hypothetical protein SCLCIDRAFT_27958 [Scleroderma citrinum Foug A]|uniref:Uncharacterized protein n=1 Tax=Scleroderma citrinum Foug A TaxID=1036808 RepID=A0A0C3DQU9_9AGAM|nr:hypothetical protein SCLCIDRAFT_27958 [Scleroderma citrinum Foug A]
MSLKLDKCIRSANSRTSLGFLDNITALKGSGLFYDMIKGEIAALVATRYTCLLIHRIRLAYVLGNIANGSRSQQDLIFTHPYILGGMYRCLANAHPDEPETEEESGRSRVRVDIEAFV